jgi:hypothetical protein
MTACFLPSPKRHSRETIVGACADYLLGVKVDEIERKWKINEGVVYYYLRKTKHFKLRSRTRQHGKILRKVP